MVCRPAAVGRGLRDRQPRLPDAGHLAGPLDQPLPQRGRVCPAVLLGARPGRAADRADRCGRRDAWRDLGYLVGWCAILVGLAGVVLHLDSRFFYDRTLKSLVYAA